MCECGIQWECVLGIVIGCGGLIAFFRILFSSLSDL